MTLQYKCIVIAIVILISSSMIIHLDQSIKNRNDNVEREFSTSDDDEDLSSTYPKKYVEGKDNQESDLSLNNIPTDIDRGSPRSHSSHNISPRSEIEKNTFQQNHGSSLHSTYSLSKRIANVERGTIRINSDNEFDRIVNEEGWSGDGSKEDPYMIEGYNISGKNEGYGIYIGNVSHHFIIQDCYLYSAVGNSHLYHRDSGIYLYNTTNGIIKNNAISNNRYGIYIQGSKKNTLLNNTIISSRGPGIFLLDGDNNTISDNFIQDEAPSKESGDVEKKDILIKFDSSRLPSATDRAEKERYLWNELKSITDEINAAPVQIFPFIEGGKLRLEDGIDSDNVLKLLSYHPLIKYAEIDRTVQLMKEPNDPGYGSLWGMQNIAVPTAWDVTTGCEEVVVAVLDTGIDYTHPDLKENMWKDENNYHGYNFVNDSYYPLDDHGHGTHVAGTIGAVGNNSLGVVGVNWNISLMSLKFIDETGRGTISDAVRSLEYVLEKKKEGVNIIATSNSWGGTGKSEILSEAIEEHRDEGILFITAAGNSNRDIEKKPSYPASYEITNVISVGATGRDDNRTSFSNYGANSVHVGAPGEGINSTAPDGEYRYSSGTSMATPHVSGLAALIAASEDSYDYNQIKNLIISSVDRLEDLEDKTLNSGRINASRAITQAPDGDINFWIHAPGNRSQREILTETNIMASLNDGVDPILGANISVEFNTGEETVYLQDDGEGWDQVGDDGYYSGSWIPEVHGNVELTFTAEVDRWQKQRSVNVTIGKEAGISLWSSRDNSIYGNNLTNSPNGLNLYRSHYNTIIGNNFSGNEFGILLENSNHTELSKNYLKDVFDGIIILESHHNELSKNYLSENIYGVYIIGGSNHTLHSNRLIDNYIGLLTTNSENNLYKGNNLSENGYGIDLFLSNNSTIVENVGHNNTIFLSIWSSQDDVIQNNTGTKNDFSTYLAYSLNAILKNNTMEDSSLMIAGADISYWDSHSIDISNTVNGDPIYYWISRTEGRVPQNAGQVILVNCTEVTVENQSLVKSSIGIISAFSRRNMIFNNTVSQNFIGIYSYLSVHNEITSNQAYQNERNGIRIFGSDNTILNDNDVQAGDGNHAIAILNSERNTLTENHMGKSGLLLDGREMRFWNTHSIGICNRVKGGEIQYWKNKTDGTMPKGAGQIILANSTGVTIADQNLSYLGDAISLGFSSNNTIYNINLYNNSYGIYLRGSDQNKFMNISSLNNTQSITMLNSNRNRISHSSFLNDTNGILISESKGNRIYLSDFSNTRRSVYLIFNSNNNKIYHNNFFESEFNPGRDRGFDNQWYSGYPEGGNYWFEHESDDNYSGPGQNESGSDGIADSPFEGAGFIDRYPLMEPITPMKIEMKQPENDSYVNKKDVIVNWTSFGGIGKRRHRVRVKGEEWIEVDNATQYEIKGLAEGRIIIQIEVIDNTGQTKNDSAVFTVDTTAPILKIIEPEERDVINYDEAKVRWEAEGKLSNIIYYEIRIDDGDWIRIEGDNQYIFKNLRNGRHTIEVRAVDQAGNTAVKEVTFFIYVYNEYFLISIVSLTGILLSYGLLTIGRAHKTDLEEKETYIDGYGRPHKKHFSEYKLDR